MNMIRLIPMVIRTGLLAGSLVLSMSSALFGEVAELTPVETDTVQTELSHQQDERSESAVFSKAMGFRTAESEGESTDLPLAPLQRSLSVKEPELVETTDASGGTMIQLQGKFQCGLKVPEKGIETGIDSTMSRPMP